MSNKKIPAYERKNNPHKLIDTAINEIKLQDFQKKFLQTIHDNKIIIGTGVAGVSKTFMSCFAAVDLYSQGRINKIIITKPIVEASHDGSSNIGFLKGSLEDKVGPYLASYFENFKKLIPNPKHFDKLIEDKTIEFIPVEYMRGRTFENSVIISDESQNFSMKMLLLLCTRLHHKSKLIIVGDENQADIKNKYVGLESFKNMINGIDKVGIFEFEKSHIMRDPILIEITERYEKWKEENE